jgi:hypothetical protein
MADEAVTRAGDRRVERRWGEEGYAGQWVRAVDAGDAGRARWIDEDDPAPTRRKEQSPGAGHAGA